MNLKRLSAFFLLIYLLLPPTYSVFAQVSNTGFIKGDIWYSRDPFEEGDKIKIYTFIFNPDSRELSGTVIFFDKTVMLGKKDFVIPAKGADDISIDWTVIIGDHSIFAKIENAKFLISKGKYEETYLTSNETEKNSRTVSKKINSTSNSNDINTSSFSTSVSGIKKVIEEKTPSFIVKPIISVTDNLEEVRKNIDTAREFKKVEIQNEIKKLDDAKTTQKDDVKTSPLLKPFKQIELFFLTISSIIFGNRFVFYSLLLGATFYILHFIWRKIF